MGNRKWICFISLLCVISHNNMVESISSIDLMMGIMEKTLPCMVPCMLDNLEPIVQEFSNKCMPIIAPQIQNITQGFSSVVSISTAGGDMDAIYSLVPEIDKMCYTLEEELLPCMRTIMNTYCGAQLTTSGLAQISQSLHWIGCTEETSKKNLVPCMMNSGMVNGMTECALQVGISHPDIIQIFQNSSDNYSDIYEKVIKTNDICKLATSFKTCLLEKMDSVPACNTDPKVKDELTSELDSVLKYAGCQGSADKYDARVCLANPEIHKAVNACITNFDYSKLQMALTPNQNSVLQVDINVTKLCDAKSLIKDCIVKEIKKACDSDKWTVKMLETITKPTLDYLTREACGEKNKPGAPLGAGKCKNKFPDFKYGEKEPDDASSSSRLLTSTLTTLILIMTAMVVNN